MVIYNLLIDYGLSGSNSRHSLLDLRKEKKIYNRRNSKEILPTNMLASLVNHKKYVTPIMIEVMADIKCQLQH